MKNTSKQIYENEKLNSYICTYTLRKFYPFNPNPNDVDIRDIAAALSKQCRFCGHCKEFYSTAQHSVLVTDCLISWGYKPEYFIHLLRYGLLHDSSETYLNDLASPTKPYIVGFKDVENTILDAILKRYSVPLTIKMKNTVKMADCCVCKTEIRDLFDNHEDDTMWTALKNYHPLNFKIQPLGPKESEILFLNKFNQLFASTTEEVLDESSIC